MIGTKLANRYEIIGELGRGGMGVVYRARDPLLGREVAAKLIPPSLLTPQAEERFRREAMLVAQMDHPAIVTIHDLGEHEGSLFFLMPVVKGQNLRGWLQQPRSLGEVLDVVIQVADALDYSHGRGVVHRDIKPENIMVSEEDGGHTRVRVMDFGLAKASSENRLTKTGTLVGTISYFSPEQVMATGEIDGRSDIYSLGIVLYECLAGQPPFAGEVQSVLYRIVHEHPRPLRSSGVEIGEELDEIILRTLAKEPGRRFQKAGELADALRRYQSRLQVSERERSVILSTTMTAQFQRPPAAPFVGREKEIVELQRRLNAAIEGEGQFVAIAGEPGIGKTRLVEEIENLARARRVRVLHGRFVEQDRAFSYQGFCEVVQEYFRGRESGETSSEGVDFSDLAADLVSLFPVLSEISELRNASSPDETRAQSEARRTDDRTQVYELLARTLTRLGGGKPLFLVFENLHGAEMSIDALQYVVRRLGPTPTLVVGTYRQTEIDRRHPLARMLDGFAGDPRFSSLSLAPFSTSEHRRFVETLVGSRELSGALAEKLFEATEANPFFTRELVRSLLDSGGISRDESGTWNLSREVGIQPGALPATIQQTVEKRIERLPDEERDLLSVAAVLGKSFDFRDLETLAERKDLEDLIDKLIRDGLIEEERESRGDRLTFSSVIVRDVLYGALSRRRRRSLHRRYAEMLERKYEGRAERIYPQLVHHFSEGDVPDKTVEYGLKLGRKSLDAFSPEDAVPVLRTVLEFLTDEDSTPDPASEGQARILLASAQRLMGNLDGAMREAEQAIALLQKGSDQAAHVSAIFLAAELAWQARRVDDADRWLQLGLDQARSIGDVQILVKLLSLASTVANLRGEYEKARQFLHEAERLEHTATGPSAEAELPRGGRLVIGIVSPAPAREPAEIAVIEEVETLGSAFEPLVSTDEHGLLIPLLCEKWEFLDGGSRLRFTLRGGVQFHDGVPLTASGVKAWFEHTVRKREQEMSAAFAAMRGGEEYRKGEAGQIAGLVAVDDSHLDIELLEPLPIYPALLTDPATAVGRVTADGKVVGTGPFVITSHDGDRIVAARNDHYWQGTTSLLDEIEFRSNMPARTIAAAVRSGQVDLARDLQPEDLDDLLRDPRFRNGLVECPRKTTYFALFRQTSPVADDALRQALFGVVRAHDLIWRTLGRQAQPASCYLPPGILGHDAGRRKSTLTREQAVELLRSTGHQLPITLRASVNPLFKNRYRSLTDALFAIWKDLGVEVEIVAATADEYLDAFKNNGNVDLMIGRWNADYDDPDNFTAGLFHSGGGALEAYFHSPETDQILEQARIETRSSAREALYHQFESRLIDSAILLPLFHEIDYRIASNRIKNLKLRSAPPYVNFAEVGRTEDSGEQKPLVRQSSGAIVVPISEEIRSLEPSLAFTWGRIEVLTNIYECLTRVVEGARVAPWLASELAVEDHGRRFRVRLRDDVRFHDGRRMTARDVRYSWERALVDSRAEMRWLLSAVRGAESVIRGDTHDLEGFRIVSSSEFTIELEQPMSFFPVVISHPSFSVVPEGTREIGRSWREGCIGTGPYRVTAFEPGATIELERNPSYWREGYPKNDSLIFRVGVSPAEIRDGFKAGKFTLASDLFPADVEAFRHDPNFASGYREVPRLSTYFVAFNTRRPPLDDLRTRKRLLAAVQVGSMVRRSLGRLGIAAHGVIPPGLLGYSPTAPPAAYGAEGAPTGEKLELTAAMHPVFFGQYAALARELLDAFEKQGVKLEVVNKTMNEYSDVEAGGSVDVTIGRWVADYPDTDTFAYGMLHSTSGSIGRFCSSPEIDRLAEQGRREIDAQVRHGLYREIEDVVRRDALLLPLFHEQVYRFAQPNLEGMSLSFSVPEVAYAALRLR